MKKHSARVAPLSACNSPVLTLTKVEGRGCPSPGGGGNDEASRLDQLQRNPLMQDQGDEPGAQLVMQYFEHVDIK